MCCRGALLERWFVVLRVFAPSRVVEVAASGGSVVFEFDSPSGVPCRGEGGLDEAVGEVTVVREVAGLVEASEGCPRTPGPGLGAQQGVLVVGVIGQNVCLVLGVS